MHCALSFVRLQFHWCISVAAPVSAVLFHPESRDSLVVACADNSFFVFQVASMQLSPWSAEYSQAIPAAVRGMPGPIEGIAFDVNRPSSVILYGQGYSVFADLNQPIPANPKRITPTTFSTAVQKRKRKGKDTSQKQDEASNFAIVSTYRSIIYMGCTDSSELVRLLFVKIVISYVLTFLALQVIMENPWVQVLGSLPDTLARDRYGT
jgi:U3 small nucleolar RNA-associated protein 4